jgi:glucose/arabinose dehydrogenase/cytochrome c2
VDEEMMKAKADAKIGWRLLSAVAITALGVAAGGSLLSPSRGEAANVQVAPERGYSVEELLTDLDHPWAMAWLPDGDMLITERSGKLRMVHGGKLLAKPVERVPQVLNTSMFDGLLDVKLDPEFAANRTIYLTFTTGTDTERTGSILKARLEGGRLLDGHVIFHTAIPAPAGGPNIMRILFMPDKTMLVGVGSGGQGSRGMVQRLDNQSGKIIHLNRDGSPVADGPFAKTAGARPEIWATGFRNPAGLTRAADGSIWTVDIGPKGGDELNLVKPGANYGWPLVSWGFDYSGRSMSERQEGEGFTDPVAVWSPSRAPSGLIQYMGNRFPQWRGDLFTGELMGHVLRRLRIRDGKVVQEEALLSELKERIRSVEVGPDGYIYAITDAATGRLLRLRPGAPGKADQARVAKPYALPEGNSMSEEFNRRGVYQERFTQILFNFKYDEPRARSLFGQNCSGCHSAGDFSSGEIGPDLNGVMGRHSGQLPGYSYSEALRNPATSLQWDRDSLAAFISNPQSYYPGTKMAVMPITDFESVLQITEFLGRTKAPAAGK